MDQPNFSLHSLADTANRDAIIISTRRPPSVPLTSHTKYYLTIHPPIAHCNQQLSWTVLCWHHPQPAFRVVLPLPLVAPTTHSAPWRAATGPVLPRCVIGLVDSFRRQPKIQHHQLLVSPTVRADSCHQIRLLFDRDPYPTPFSFPPFSCCHEKEGSPECSHQLRKNDDWRAVFQGR